MRNLKLGLLLGAAFALSTGIAEAGGIWSQFPAASSNPTTGNATTFPLTGNELSGFDTELSSGANPQTEQITVNQLSTFAGSVGQSGNFIVAGHSDTNLWQRGTTGSSKTTTVGYGTTGGPDRWVYWSGTNTAVTLSRTSTAALLPTGSATAFKFQRTSGQTGVVQSCMAQEILTSRAQQLAGHTVEADFFGHSGAQFSPTSINVYIVYGTGTDEGTTNLAFGLNAGGGGSSGWTGQANATAGLISGLTTSSNYNFAAVATMPATATEAALAICLNVTGTAGTNDALTVDDIELRRADSLAGFANATTGYLATGTGGVNGSGNIITNGALQAVIPAYAIQDNVTEAINQYFYYYQLNEPAANAPVGMGVYYTATECDVVIPFPVTMRAAPTLTFVGTAPSNATYAVINSVGGATPQALATDFLTASGVTPVSTVSAGHLEATTATVTTAGLGCELVGAGGGANLQWSSEL